MEQSVIPEDKILSRQEAPQPANARTPKARDEILFPKTPVTFEGALDLLNKASPGPYRAVLGRIGAKTGVMKRIDIYDTNGRLMMHFHAVPGEPEATPNWEADAAMLIHQSEIIAALQAELERLRNGT